MQTTPNTLYYVHDPMCSWCYAFRPVWKQVREHLPAGLELRYVLGGLAADSDEAMPEETRQYVQEAWRKIMRVVPGTTFNFDFWTQCEPRRATYPSCRAMVAAKRMGAGYELPMLEGIQDAYYQQARNPSDDSTLIAIAESIGLDREHFALALASDEVARAFQEDLELADRIGGHSFPSLILEHNGQLHRFAHSYTDADSILQQINAQIQVWLLA